MKKVLEFVYYLFDGGAETLVKQYCLMLDKTEFTPIVLTLYPKNDSAVYKELVEAGIKIYNVYPKRDFLYRVINKCIGRFYFRFRIRQIIRKESIDVIHCHTAVLRYIKYAQRHLNNINLLYTCHSTLDRYFSGHVKKEYEAASYLLHHNDMQMIALHDDMRNELNKLFSINSTVVIRNGIDLNRYRDDHKTREKVRKELGIPESAFVVGHVGRFFEPKNHEFLIKVFVEIKKIRADAFLLMIGDGILRNDIERKLHENGLDDSYMILSNRNDVPELLTAMDTFIFPSKVEGFGIALIEAQAAGLKCVTSTAVPDAACLTSLVEKKSLEDLPLEWCEAALKQRPTNWNKDKLNQYDMQREIRKLEDLYRKSGVCNQDGI